MYPLPSHYVCVCVCVCVRLFQDHRPTNDFFLLETLTTSIDVGTGDQVYHACQFRCFLLNDDD